MSTLSRLFVFAKVSALEACENFTTEALAGAIRENSSPMLRLLAQHGAGLENTERCTPYTQVPFPGAGIVDLVLQLESAERVRELWIEVKVDAPESGEQLQHYREYIGRNGASLDRDLIVLSKTRLDSAVPFVWIPWQDLAAAIRSEAPTDPVWLDFVTYLEEIRMTDSATFPMTVHEAAVMSDAAAFLRKSIRVLASVNDRIKASSPAFPSYLGLSGKSVVQWQAFDQFFRFGRASVYDNTRPPQLFYGLAPRSGEPWAQVWIERDPRATAERKQIREFAASRLDDTWSRPLDESRLLVKSRRAILFESEQEAIDWFVGRLVELRDSGILEFLPTLGASAVDVRPENDVDPSGLDDQPDRMDVAEQDQRA